MRLCENCNQRKSSKSRGRLLYQERSNQSHVKIQKIEKHYVDIIRYLKQKQETGIYSINVWKYG